MGSVLSLDQKKNSFCFTIVFEPYCMFVPVLLLMTPVWSLPRLRKKAVFLTNEGIVNPEDILCEVNLTPVLFPSRAKKCQNANLVIRRH